MSDTPRLLSATGRLPAFFAHAASLAVIGLVLVSVGQPIFTDDTWWHLAIGEIYARSGPWLEADPFLFAAEGPPAPAAWLSDVLFVLVHRASGFQGLRVAHVLVVAATIALAWRMLRRTSGSALIASLGTTLFTLLSAYRFFQLRPHLFSILAGLLLIHLLVVERSPLTGRRIAAATVVMALWANAHGAFVLGPVLLASAIAGVVGGALLWPELRAESWPRVRRLLLALGLGLLGSLANPTGPGVHLLYFAAGGETPDLSIVADEWAPVALFSLPPPNLPPTALNWAIVWGLLLSTAFALISCLARRRRGGASGGAPRVDPALIGLAGIGLVGMLSAVRLLWLGLLPMLFVGAALLERDGRRAGVGRPLAWPFAGALLTVLLVPGFLKIGDWPMISKAVRPSWYARPYIATKHHAHAVWLLRDAGLEGRLFNDYSSGNFLSYWVTPQLKVFLNGSLNVPIDVLEANRAIERRSGLGPGRGLLELLDEQRVDVFLGAGEPRVSLPGRPAISTTTHLEGVPGWIMVFRNMRSAIYLRDVTRNRANLRRVAEYYAAEGVPFDPQRGFAPLQVLQASPGWAVAHGLVPLDFEQTRAAARSPVPAIRAQAQARLASIYAVTGVYERAVDLDERLLRSDPGSVPSARRLVWALLHLRRLEEGLAAAERLAEIASPEDRLSGSIVLTARHAASRSEEEHAAWVALLPVLTRPEGHRLFRGYIEPADRPGRNPQSRH